MQLALRGTDGSVQTSTVYWDPTSRRRSRQSWCECMISRSRWSLSSPSGYALAHLSFLEVQRESTKSSNRSRADRRRLAVLLAIAGIAAQNAKPAATKYPPQFPREGATKLFENEHVIVWEQVGRPKEAFVHKHIRDILNFPLDPGGGIAVLNPDGSKGTGSSLTQTIYNAELDDLFEGRNRSARRGHGGPEQARAVDFRRDQRNRAEGLPGVEYGLPRRLRSVLKVRARCCTVAAGCYGFADCAWRAVAANSTVRQLSPRR